MRAAILRELGTAPRCEDVTEPVAAEGHVLIDVRAVSVKPIDKQLAKGSHYASERPLPAVVGVDGVGTLADGTRVYFGGGNGTLAERVSARMHLPLPDALDDVTAAALINPGMSAWLSLRCRAELAEGQSVLVLGATGHTGTLAVRIAKLLGAGRVIAAGRNRQALAELREIGADEVIQFDDADTLTEAFTRMGHVDVVLDYLWGKPTEALLAALTRHDLAGGGERTRLVQVGESAGATVALPAGTLRSTALEIVGNGTGTLPSFQVMGEVYRELTARAAAGELGIRTRTAALTDIEEAWDSPDPERRRLVVLTG